jgi:hypothetical protein
MFVDINFSKDKFQKYINLYIKNTKKTLIFVGLNNMPWWEIITIIYTHNIIIILLLIMISISKELCKIFCRYVY